MPQSLIPMPPSWASTQTKDLLEGQDTSTECVPATMKVPAHGRPTRTPQTVPAQAPDVPELTATTTGTSSIRLSWTESNANGTADADFPGYVIQRWNSHAEPPAWSPNITIVGRDNTLHVDIGEGDGRNGMIDGNEVALSAGTTYYYQVRANTTAENWSAVESAVTIAAAPDRPQNLSAEADGQTAIDLSWDAPEKDGGNAIVRYELERWDSTATQWVSVNNALSATSTTYKHRNLTAGTRNIYRLRAVNRAPTNGGLGSWSTMASAMTDAAE